MKFTTTLVALSAILSASAVPMPHNNNNGGNGNGNSFTKQNGFDAIGLNSKFAQLTPDSPCDAGENACVNNQFAQCVNGKFVLQPCASGLICAALPLVNSAGTSVTCTTAADRDARIAATGASNDNAGGNDGSNNGNDNGNNGGNNDGNNGGNNGNNGGNDNGNDNGDNGGNNNGNNGGNNNGNNGGNNNGNNGGNDGGNGGNNDDLQSSLQLDPSLVQTGYEQDGQQTPTEGQVASATSKNNFINFCATVPNLPLTNGQQVVDGSCNAAPMGVIASSKNMPSCKFTSPKNLDTIKANTPFTIKMSIKHLTTGFFTNANANYFSAPQTVDQNGDIQGHSHVVIEQIPSLTSTDVSDPSKFAFFKGLNAKAVNGELTADVTAGLPAGVYRMASINSSSNHQPALVAIAQHGALDDMIYFTVSESGK